MSDAGLAALSPLAVVVPIVGALISLLAARISTRGALLVSLASLGGASAVLLLAAPRVYGGDLLSHALGNVGPVHGQELGVVFTVDPFGLTFAIVTTVVGAVFLISTLSELGDLGPREIGGYACLFQLLLASLVGIALTADSVDLFVWFEVAALASYGLTGFFLERPLALEATFKILVLTTMASFVVFVGATVLYDVTGALNLGQLSRDLPAHPSAPALVASGLLVAGFATKAGLIPFHGWLADAHTAAPGPVSALFSALMVNLGVVAIARIAHDVLAGHHTHVLGLMTGLGAVSAVLGAALALGQDELKRVLAYDTVSQMGVLMVGFGSSEAAGLAGASYHLVDHALFKGLLFLCAGSVVHATGLTKLSEMGGLARHRPVTTVAFVVGAAAICGVPPLNGYISIGLIHDAARHSDPFVFGVLVLAQVLTVAALARTVLLAFFRRRDDDYDSLERPRPGMLIAFGSLAAGCVALGVLPGVVLRHVAAPAAAVLQQPGAYAAAALGGPSRLVVPHLSFHYYAASELATALGTLVVGIALAVWYVRRDREPAAMTWLRRLHTGSVNDYAAYATAGIVLTAGVLLLR